MQEQKTVKKEKPILFSAPMVRAILDGNKTQTRRVVKLPKKSRWGNEYDGCVIVDDGSTFGVDMPVDELICPYGRVGDHLWVRETFCIGVKDNSEYVKIYKASVDDETAKEFKGIWKPSIFMPRSASRILLEITNVRAERLRDISEQDAIAEGIESMLWCDNTIKYKHYKFKINGCRIIGTNAKESYFSLWESINGSASLEENPWVWVVEFKRVGGAI